MRTKITLLLLFFNVVLFFFIFKFERGWRTDLATLEARRRVLGPESTDIRSLVITNEKNSLTLEKRPEGWFITKPIDWPANPNAVSSILNELQFLEHDASFKVADLDKSKQTLADYGLDQPVLTVAFTSGDSAASKTPTLLRIGHATKVDNRLYILSPDGQRVHVVSRGLSDSLTKSLDQLRSDSLFNIPVFEVRSFSLQPASNLRIRLRREGNRWSFETPIIARASKTATELAINALNGLRLRSFVDKYPLENTPAVSPALRLSIEGNNRIETLLVGERVTPAGPQTSADKSTDYYAMLDRRATLFTVSIPNDFMESLRNAQETLRETRLFDFDARAVTAITLSAPNRPEITLQRLESTNDTPSWQVIRRDSTQGPLTQPADSKVVQRLLDQLALVSAKKFLSDAPQAADLENWGFNRPERKITIAAATGNNGTAPITLEVGVGADRSAEAYARLTSDPFIYAIDTSILNETPVEARAYRDRIVNELPAGARIIGLTLTDTASKAVLYQHDVSGDDSWEKSLATEKADRRSAIQSLLNQLRTLRAKNFVLDHFPERVELAGEERPWKYSLTVSLALVGGNGAQTADTQTLFFTDRVGGDLQLAGSPKFACVFEIEQPMLDALWTLTYGPRDPGADQDKAPIPAPAKK